MNPEEIKKMGQFIKSLHPEKIREINKREIDNTKAQYADFIDKFSKGECYICKLKLDVFEENNPCVHWLLRPKGFKKNHFDLILQRFDYSNIDSYLRWIANQEAVFKNINDLSEERRDSMMFEYIIKYKNFEWLFSCSKGDFEGHKGTKHEYPHYHIQMRINNQPFINFSDFHIPLNNHDQYIIRVKRGEIEGIAHQDGFGTGMDSFFKNVSPEDILKYAKTTENGSKSSIHTTYIIEAESGTTISGDEIADLMQESRKTNTPLWNLLPRLKKTKQSAIVSPGEGVPKIFQRGKSKNDEK